MVGVGCDRSTGVKSEMPVDAIIEFLKTLQVLPPGTHSLVVDESGRPKTWPPRP
jgi:hypothetical protein